MTSSALSEAWERRRQAKHGKSVEKDKFLSTVNDLDADISIRFDFTVVGSDSLHISQAVCSSPSAAAVVGADSPAAGPVSPQRSTRLRCHCELTHPDVGAPGEPVVARLAFNAVQYHQEIPTCSSRQEALGSAIVFCLDIARKDATGEPAFAEQLEALKDSIRTLRERSRRILRPVKALLLYSSDNVRPTSSLEVWALQLADFEQEFGDMWKFGPATLQDADGMHGIFQEITCVRTVSRADKKDEMEAEDQDAEEVYTSGEAGQVAFLVPTSRHRAPSVSSSVSVGQLPPQYEAEAESGSECSESAWEQQGGGAGGGAPAPRLPGGIETAGLGAAADEPMSPTSILSALSPSSALRAYDARLKTSPTPTKLLTAAVTSVLSELISWKVSGRKGTSTDVARQVGVGVSMAMVMAKWHASIERVFVGWPTKSLSTVATKTAFGMILLQPVMAAIFISLSKLLRGQRDVVQALQKTLVNAIVSGWLVWTPTNAMQYAVVPERYRTLVNSLVSMLYTTYLILSTKNA